MTLTPEEATAALIRTVPALQQEGIESMQQAVELTFQRMSELAPHGETGKLGRDVQHSVRQTRDGVAGTVRPRAPWAGFVEGGTGEGKTLRHRGSAYSATTGHALTTAEELAHPFDVLTAAGWGPKTAKALALHVRGGVIYRSHVRGQRAQGFVQRTRDATADEVERVLTAGAERATEKIFR